MQLEADTDIVREMTRGQMVISCPDCGESVAWGNIRSVLISKNVVVLGGVKRVGSHHWIEINNLFTYDKSMI